jgi:hypothetical protein
MGYIAISKSNGHRETLSQKNKKEGREGGRRKIHITYIN